MVWPPSPPADRTGAGHEQRQLTTAAQRALTRVVAREIRVGVSTGASAGEGALMAAARPTRKKGRADLVCQREREPLEDVEESRWWRISWTHHQIHYLGTSDHT